MCDVCVIDAVKDRMLSRRRFFSSSIGGAAVVAAGAATTGPLAPPLALADDLQRVEDMTHELHEDFPTYFGESQFSREQLFNWDEHRFNLFQLTVNEHTGTHIDAPLHFSPDGLSVAELPVENLVVPLCVINIADRAANDPDTQVTPDDIAAWIRTHGDIPDRACVAMHSGWAPKVDTREFRNADADGVQHYPGFHVEAVHMLLETSQAMSIAVDTLSLDHGMSTDFATHYAWLPTGRFGIENLANLHKVPANGATLVVGAPKHRGGTGGPARIFALH